MSWMACKRDWERCFSCLDVCAWGVLMKSSIYTSRRYFSVVYLLLGISSCSSCTIVVFSSRGCGGMAPSGISAYCAAMSCALSDALLNNAWDSTQPIWTEFGMTILTYSSSVVGMTMKNCTPCSFG